jgi:hypothetical protein
MRTIWERVIGKEYYLNTSCGNCVLAFFKQIGGELRKQKAEAAPKKPTTKKK